MRKLIFVGPVAALAVALWLASAAFAQQTTLTVPLGEQNGSGVSGTATLTDLGGSVRVDIAVSPGGNANMPAHIHTGACPNPGAVKFPLSNVVDGRSTTVVQGSFAEVAATGQAVNLHKSPQEIPNYTACGDIPFRAAAGSARAGGLDPTMVVGGLVLVGTVLLLGGGVLRRRHV